MSELLNRNWYICDLRTGLVIIQTHIISRKPVKIFHFRIQPECRCRKRLTGNQFLHKWNMSLLFAADKEAALLFVLFFGYYPVLKSFLERISNKVLSWISKFAVFNVAVVACFFLAVNFLQLPEDSFTVFGIYLPWVFLILGNAVFLIYDIALSGLVATYVEKLHHRVTKTLK